MNAGADRFAPSRISVLTCPHCGHRHTETMPDDACICFFECKGCATMLRPKPGDCCVFCSYGSVPCPPIQAERAGGASAESDHKC
jgi:hypothetical protein